MMVPTRSRFASRLLLLAMGIAAAGCASSGGMNVSYYPCPRDRTTDTVVVVRTGGELRCSQSLTDSLKYRGPLLPRVDTVFVPWGRDTTAPPSVRPEQAIAPTSNRSNEPDGMTTVYDSSPESDDWRRNGSATVVTDSSAPRSAPGVVRITYPGGFRAGSAPGAFYPSRGFGGRTAYYSAHLRLSNNFQANPTGINKLVHFYICGLNRLFLMANGGGLTVAIGLQQLAYPYNGGTATNLIGSRSFVRGRWHHVEMVLLANTPGRRDGTITVWLDGARVISHSGIGFCESGSGQWEGLNHSPTWGGAEGRVASPFYIDWDHVRMSSK